jgi:hypothetical protein
MSKCISQGKEPLLTEVLLSKGSTLVHENITYIIEDISLKIFNQLVDLEKFGVNKCGANQEIPFNLQVILYLRKV